MIYPSNLLTSLRNSDTRVTWRRTERRYYVTTRLTRAAAARSDDSRMRQAHRSKCASPRWSLFKIKSIAFEMRGAERRAGRSLPAPRTSLTTHARCAAGASKGGFGASIDCIKRTHRCCCCCRCRQTTRLSCSKDGSFIIQRGLVTVFFFNI